jgi:hypothetical protein
MGQVAPVAIVAARPAAAPRIDRKCADCAADDEPLELQRMPASSDHSFGDVALFAPADAVTVSQPEDPAEHDADRAAAEVMTALSPAPPHETDRAAAAALLLDDDAAALQPGQMRKTEFLQALRPAVCASADRELARAGRNTAGCPYLDRWFDYYQGRDAAHVERSLRKYAPAAASATSARDYIAPVADRVAQGVQRWVETGQVPELPDGLSPDLAAGGGVLGAVASVGSAIASGVAAIGNFFGGLFRKATDRGAAPAVDRGTLNAQLGDGHALDGTARSRMGAAFGHDFGAVRVHTDGSAASLASQLNARAFTVGTHIAFGPGQYRPGEPAGDALIAHELAHVVQQHGAAAPPRPARPASDALERDADRSAVATMQALWGPAGAKARPAKPALRSGLQLSRCAGPQVPLPEGIGTSHAPPPPPPTFANVDPRTTPQTVDRMIAASGFLQPYIAERHRAGVQATGHLHIDTDDDFRRHYVAYLQRSLNPATGKRFTADEAEQEASLGKSDGFDDGREMYLRGLNATTITALHETIHAYAEDDFVDAVGPDANEGATEYFTDIVLADNQQGPDASAYTQNQLPPVQQLVAALGGNGKQLLAAAYFQGRIAPLRAALDQAKGAGTFARWVAAMKAKDFAAASGIVS